MSGQLNELRLQVERLDYDNKESIITIDILKEQNHDAKNELEELKKTIADLKAAQKDASAEDKEKRKQEKMALMMAKFDAVSTSICGWLCMALNCRRFCSKARSLRRTSNFARYWPSWMLSTTTVVSRRCPMMTLSPCGDSLLRARPLSARPSTVCVRLRRRTRCMLGAGTNSRLVLRPSSLNTRNSLVRLSALFISQIIAQSHIVNREDHSRRGGQQRRCRGVDGGA